MSTTPGEGEVVVRPEGEVLEKDKSDRMLNIEDAVSRIAGSMESEVSAAQPVAPLPVETPRISDVARQAIEAVLDINGNAYGLPVTLLVDGNRTIDMPIAPRSRFVPSVSVDPSVLKAPFSAINHVESYIAFSTERASEGMDADMAMKAEKVFVYLLSLLNRLYRNSELNLDEKLPSPTYNGGESGSAREFFNGNEDAIFVFVKGLQDLLRLRESDSVVALPTMLRNINNLLNAAVKEGIITANERGALDGFMQRSLMGLVQHGNYSNQGVLPALTGSEEESVNIKRLVASSITDDDVVGDIKTGTAYTDLQDEINGYTDPTVNHELQGDVISSVLSDEATRSAYLKAVADGVRAGAYKIDVRATYGANYDRDLSRRVAAAIAEPVSQKALAEYGKTHPAYARMSDVDMMKAVGSKPDFVSLRNRFVSEAQAQAQADAEAELRKIVLDGLADTIEKCDNEDDLFNNPTIRELLFDESSEAYRQHIIPAITAFLTKLRSDVITSLKGSQDLLLEGEAFMVAKDQMIERVTAQEIAEMRSRTISIYGCPVRLADDQIVGQLRGAVDESADRARTTFNRFLFLSPVVRM